MFRNFLREKCVDQKKQNFWKCFAKISVTKFRKLKIWDGYLVRFSVLIVVVYSIFSVDAFFTEKNAKQNGLFWVFSKKRKSMKMFRKNLCDKVSKMKNLRLLSCSFFRADRRGVLRFFGRRIFHRENCETKSPVLSFFKNTKIYENVSQKSLWQSFENKKSDMAIFSFFCGVLRFLVDDFFMEKIAKQNHLFYSISGNLLLKRTVEP